MLYWTDVHDPTGALALHHDCPVAGTVEVSLDWKFCPWCGRGLVRAIAKARKDNPAAARMADDPLTDWADI